MNSQRGFTLIEVGIVIAVVAEHDQRQSGTRAVDCVITRTCINHNASIERVDDRVIQDQLSLQAGELLDLESLSADLGRLF